MLNNVIKKPGIVRDDDGCAWRVDQVSLEPLDIVAVYEAGGLVEKKDIGIIEHAGFRIVRLVKSWRQDQAGQSW